MNLAITSSMEEYTLDQDEIEDGEISIVFWSCAFVILLIVTVWFYITQIAPMRRSAGRQITDEEIDREEEVAKRILEHLSDDLQFKSDISKEDGLKNAASALSTKTEESSVYEYIDDEIHIHYSRYGWDDECDDESSDYSSTLAAARRHSMENMDLIFPGFLPSIVEEEEEESDTESSEKSQDTDDLDGKFNDLSNLPTVYKQLANNNGGLLESSMNGEYNYSETGERIFAFIESQESGSKESKRREDGVVICKPAESYSLNAFENVNNAVAFKSVSEPVKTEQNGTSLLSGKSDNRPQVFDTENCKNIPSAEPARHSTAGESVIPTKCRSVAETTSGGFDTDSDKEQKKKKLDNLFEVNGDAIENNSMFTISNCDLAPVLKQDANEIEEPKLCASNEQKISHPVNGVERYFTRDIRSKHPKNDENAHDNTENELDSELSDASSEDTSGLTGIKMDVNKSEIAEFNLNGFVDEIAGTNDHTTHSWTFFSMSGSDDTTAPADKGIPNGKQQSDRVEVPKIIIDSYDDGLQSHKLNPNEDSIDMNENATHGDSFETDTFETDIDIDDVDLIDSDDLEEEGEFSIYFKRHVSVTDLDKILSEEGQAEANGDSSKEVLETDLSVDEPPNVEENHVDISTTRTVLSSERETNIYDTGRETKYVDDGSDMNIQKSIVVTSKLSDCLDKQPSTNEPEQLEEVDSLLKSYAVETLMDDVSFEKDGVYGELVLSKLNESHRDQPDDISFDSYGEDWSGFAEEYRRDRRPILYTIPEDEEIGLPETEYRRENNAWGQAKFNYSNDNEISAAKEPGLKAPIATMDASDSEYDLDDYSGSETEKSGGEMGEDTEEKDRQKIPDEPDLHKIASYNGVTVNGGIKTLKDLASDEKSNKIVPLNGVTEKPDFGGVRDAISDEHKRSEEPGLSEKIPTYNGVTSNGGSTVAVDNTRSVKIVKKIKIFVRKEVTIAKDDQELLRSPKQLIEDFGDHVKDKTDGSNEINAKKEVKEAEIIPECREGKTHPAYDVFKAENDSVTNAMQPLNFLEEQCDISEVNAKKMETLIKQEHYAASKPEPQVVDEVIEARVSTLEADAPELDITQYFAEPATKSDQTKIDAKSESKIEAETLKARPSLAEGDASKSDITENTAVSPANSDKTEVNGTSKAKIVPEDVETRELPVEKEATGRDITQHSEKPSDQKDQTKTVAEPESKSAAETTKALPVEADTPVRAINPFSPRKTRQKHLSRMVARFESKIEAETIKARKSSLEGPVPTPDVTQDVEKPPAQPDQAKNVAKLTPAIIKASAPSVETNVPKRDVTQHFEKPPAQSDQTKIKGTSTPETNIPKHDVTQHLEKRPAQNDNTKIIDKIESKSTPETVKVSALPVEASISKRDVTQHLEKRPAQNDNTKIIDKTESKSTPEIVKMSAVPVEASISKPDVTQHLEKRPAQNDKTKIIDKTESKSTPEIVKMSAVPVEASISKPDVTQHLEKRPAQNDKTKIIDKTESKSTPEIVKMSAVPVEASISKRDVTQHLENRPAQSENKPELKLTPETIKTSVLSVETEVPKRDVTQPLEKPPAQIEQTRIIDTPESIVAPDITKTRTTDVEAEVPKCDVTQQLEKGLAQTEQTKITDTPESTVAPDIIKARTTDVEAEVPKRDVTKQLEKGPAQSEQTKIDDTSESKVTTELIKARPSSVEAELPKRVVTQHLQKLPRRSDQTKIDTKPESRTKPMKALPVEAEVPKRGIVKDFEKLPAQSDQTKINAQPESKLVDEAIKARVSTVQVHSPEDDITKHIAKLPTQNDQMKIYSKSESKTTQETIKASAAFEGAVAPKRGITKDFAKLHAQSDQTKIASTEEVAKSDAKDNVGGKPIRSNVELKVFISGKRSKEDPKEVKEDTNAFTKETVLSEETEIQPLESPAVKISVQGKDSQEEREGRRVRSPTRMSPKSWEKMPKKTYLTSRNIRLTKSHEDLRFLETAPEGLQDSIQEEEASDQALLLSNSNSLLTQSIPEDDAIESVEPSSIHTAKITVQEVIGDKQRILILNVKKKVHGKARWKSLNDLDSIKKAVTPPRRSSDLGNNSASFAEDAEETEELKGLKILPMVEVKTRHDRSSVPEMEETRSEQKVASPRRSPILKVTALQDRESIPENDTPRVIRARVMPVLQEGESENGEILREIKEKDTPRQEFKARVTQISPRDSKPRAEREVIADVDGREYKPQDREVRASHVSPVVEAIPRLERETVTEISDAATKGNKIKVRVARVTPTEEFPPHMEDKVLRPHSSPTVEAMPKRDDREIESRISQISPIMEVRYRRGRESGYGSLEMKDNDFRSANGLHTTGSVRADAVFTLGGANERRVSSLSSLEDEYDGEILGESRVMVTDLDALLAQQSTADIEEKPRSQSPETHEVTEKVHVWARMEPGPEKVVRINSNEEDDDDSLVIHHVKTEEPIVIKPVIVTEAAADNKESNVISAFLVNDGYDDDELDEVFLEEYPPYGYPNSPGHSTRRHSSDADSETSSVSSLPHKHRHRQTRAALEAANSGVRNRTESSGSSKTATPVAELENEKAATSSGSSTPEIKANEISRDESFTFKTPQQSLPVANEKPTKFTSAFISLSRTTEVRRPRARSDHSARKSDEEPSTQSKALGTNLQKKGLGTSVQDVQTMPGLDIDKQRFKEAADSRKSMPDLTKKQHPINDSPFLRGLSAHTRRWLSQNAWMDNSEQQDQEDLMTSDLFLYPSNRFQPGPNIDASFMSLAGDRGERDFPDDISVSTLSTRPQSPMSEFSFAGETPYWGMRRGSTTTIKCSNPRCEQEEVLFAGEKTTYTSCPACFTYYCTRGCRRIHWSEHKKICFFGRINSYIRSFIYLCHKKEGLKFQLSTAAREGFKRKGRGCVLVTFASPQSARKFMTTGCTFFPSPPTYSSLQDLQAEGVVSKHRVALTQNIKDYQPDEEFVLNLAIIAGKMENLPANPVPRRKVNTVLQVIKIPLSSKLKETIPSPAPSDPKTETKVFYLPKCARHEFVSENEARRHYCRNISKNLKQYGIRLKNDYPDVYEKLCLYVDQNIRFKEPLTVYGNQGKKIVMCKIMPEAADDVQKN